MTREELDTLWFQAMRQSIEEGEDFIRYHFAALVADHEREACAKVCESLGVHPALNVFNGGPEWYKHGKNCAAAIRARGQENKS